MSSDPSGLVVGWIAALFGAIGFGSFAVPIKVRHFFLSCIIISFNLFLTRPSLQYFKYQMHICNIELNIFNLSGRSSKFRRHRSVSNAIIQKYDVFFDELVSFASWYVYLCFTFEYKLRLLYCIFF